MSSFHALEVSDADLLEAIEGGDRVAGADSVQVRVVRGDGTHKVRQLDLLRQGMVCEARLAISNGEDRCREIEGRLFERRCFLQAKRKKTTQDWSTEGEHHECTQNRKNKTKKKEFIFCSQAQWEALMNDWK